MLCGEFCAHSSKTVRWKPISKFIPFPFERRFVSQQSSSVQWFWRRKKNSSSCSRKKNFLAESNFIGFRKVVKVDWDIPHKISNRDPHTHSHASRLSITTQPTQMCVYTVCPCHAISASVIRFGGRQRMNEWVNVWPKKSERVRERASERARAANVKLVKCLWYLIYLPCSAIVIVRCAVCVCIRSCTCTFWCLLWF